MVMIVIMTKTYLNEFVTFFVVDIGCRACIVYHVSNKADAN